MNTTTAVNITGSAEIVEAEEETPGTTVTVTTRTPLNWTAAAVGKNVTIAGVPIAGYDGTFAVTAIVSASSFTYTNPTTGLGDALGGGTVNFSAMPTTRHMPYSACSTCHEGTNGDNPAKTEAMQQIIDQRQEWTQTMVDEVMATLDAKAVQMGFADAAAAVADADVANSDFGKAWTNMELVAQEGSYGRPQLAVRRGRHQQGHGAGRRLQGAGRRRDHHGQCCHGHLRHDAHPLRYRHHCDWWSGADGRRSGEAVHQRDAGELRHAQRFRQLQLHRRPAEQEHDLRDPVPGRRQLRAHRRRQHRRQGRLQGDAIGVQDVRERGHAR